MGLGYDGFILSLISLALRAPRLIAEVNEASRLVGSRAESKYFEADTPLPFTMNSIQKIDLEGDKRGLILTYMIIKKRREETRSEVQSGRENVAELFEQLAI